jgi:two-component system sensor histidine kinase ChvG
VRSGRGRGDIPNFPERDDEIGDLADSLKSMTAGLYDRIDAIERFAADVAHELKNPLTSLASAVEMFGRAKDDESRARLLGIIRGDVKRIDRLITDISDASRLDAELSREAPQPVALSRLLATIIEVYRMTDADHAVEFVLADQLPPGTIVRGRDERLGQVFRNLIDNAVSFSPAGGTVTITALRHEMVARVMVEDEGPGIPADNLESIFERFYTERHLRAQFRPGTVHRPPDHRRRGRTHLCRKPRFRNSAERRGPADRRTADRSFLSHDR